MRHSCGVSFVHASLITIVVYSSGAPALRAALPSEPVEVQLKPAELGDVLRRIGDVAAGEAWQKQGWRDPLIDGWLENLMGQVRAATGDETRALPVRFADVQPQAQAAGAAPVGQVDRIVVERAGPVAAAPAGAAGGGANARVVVVNPVQRVPVLNKALVVGQNLELAHAHGSIILADGNARVSFANNCVIIARGAVYVAHGSGNVIVAGHFIHVSHDGRSRPVRNPAGPGFARAPGGGPAMEVAQAGAVIVSGGAIDVSHAAGTVFVATNALRVSHAHSCTFINRPADAAISHQNDSRDVAAPQLRVARPPHPIGARVTLDWLTPRKGAVFRFQDRRYVADLGKPITDEAGKPVPELDGWALSFCDEGYALFSRDRDDFGVTMPASTPE